MAAFVQDDSLLKIRANDAVIETDDPTLPDRHAQDGEAARLHHDGRIEVSGEGRARPCVRLPVRSPLIEEL